MQKLSDNEVASAIFLIVTLAISFCLWMPDGSDRAVRNDDRKSENQKIEQRVSRAQNTGRWTRLYNQEMVYCTQAKATKE